MLHSVCGQVARYIQSVSDVGDNPKLQETLENLKPYVFLGSTRNRICIWNCVMMFCSLLVVCILELKAPFASAVFGVLLCGGLRIPIAH